MVELAMRQAQQQPDPRRQTARHQPRCRYKLKKFDLIRALKKARRPALRISKDRTAQLSETGGGLFLCPRHPHLCLQSRQRTTVMIKTELDVRLNP